MTTHNFYAKRFWKHFFNWRLGRHLHLQKRECHRARTTNLFQEPARTWSHLTDENRHLFLSSRDRQYSLRAEWLNYQLSTMQWNIPWWEDIKRQDNDKEWSSDTRRHMQRPRSYGLSRALWQWWCVRQRIVQDPTADTASHESQLQLRTKITKVQ